MRRPLDSQWGSHVCSRFGEGACRRREQKHKKVGGEPPASLLDARRVLAEEKLRQYIERTVASAPPLTASQLDRLRVLLHCGAQ